MAQQVDDRRPRHDHIFRPLGTAGSRVSTLTPEALDIAPERRRHEPALEPIAARIARRARFFDQATPEVIAAAIAEQLGGPVDYRPVETDGAARAAALIGELL